MKNTVNFLKQCQCFWIVTNNGSYPSARPFGAVMVWKNRIYMPTNANKKVYKQILFDRHVCIVAIKPKSRTWMRLTGDATTCNDLSIKKRMWKLYPILAKRYKSYENEDFRLLELRLKSKELHLD